MEKSPFELSLERLSQERGERFRAELRESSTEWSWASKILEVSAADSIPPPPTSAGVKDIDALLEIGERDAAVIGAFNPDTMVRHVLGPVVDKNLEALLKARLLRSCRITGARWMLQAEPRRAHIRRLAESGSPKETIDQVIQRTEKLAAPEPFTQALRSALRGVLPHWTLRQLAPERVYAAMEFAFPVVPGAPDPRQLRRHLAHTELSKVGRNFVSFVNFPIRERIREFVNAERGAAELPVLQLFGGEPSIRFDFLASLCAASFEDNRHDYVLLTMKRPTLDQGDYDALVREIELQLQLQGGQDVRMRDGRRAQWEPADRPNAKAARLVLLCSRPDEIAPAAQEQFARSLQILQSEYARGRLRTVLSTPTSNPVANLSAEKLEFNGMREFTERAVARIREVTRKRDDDEGGSTPATA